MLPSPFDLWKAIEILKLYGALERYEYHEDKFIDNLFNYSNPVNTEKELSDKQMLLIKKLYKKYIWIDFKGN